MVLQAIPSTASRILYEDATESSGWACGTKRQRPSRQELKLHLTGKLAVCAGSCGPGNLHLINGLYDAHRSRVPVLAIAAQIPSQEIGSGYFQETHPEHLFKECSHFCELVSSPTQMPRTLEIAIQTALAKRGVAVVVLPGDIALLNAENDDRRVNFTIFSAAHCSPSGRVGSAGVRTQSRDASDNPGRRRLCGRA